MAGSRKKREALAILEQRHAQPVAVADPVSLMRRIRREWTEEERDRVVTEVLARVAMGEPLAIVLKSDDRLPAMTTFMEWLDSMPQWGVAYLRAREAQAEAIDGKIHQLAEEVDSLNATGHKVKIDTLRWRASKLNPRRYGDKIQAEVTADVNVTSTIVDATRLEPDAREALRLALQASRVSQTSD